MGYLHHSVYVQYLEMGRIESLRASGYSYAKLEEEGIFFVVVKVQVHYKGAGALRRGTGAHDHRRPQDLRPPSTTLTCSKRGENGRRGGGRRPSPASAGMENSRPMPDFMLAEDAK